jgi:hypothetical protein
MHSSVIARRSTTILGQGIADGSYWALTSIDYGQPMEVTN